MNPKVRLAVAAALFLGWLGWLGYAAAVKSRAPVVSRAEAAVAPYTVVAFIRMSPDGKMPTQVHVSEVLAGKEHNPAAPTDLRVSNLAETAGFDGDGDYLLFLRPDSLTGGYEVVGPPRSPGLDPSSAVKPQIYRWSEDVRGQVKAMRP